MMWTLFWLFARIGLFTIGGGPAMLPLVQQSLVEYGWMSLQETIDMVAISQMTPGPFAVNAATFTGMRLRGVWGAAVATLGIMTPSFAIVMVVAHYFFRFQNSLTVQAVLKGVRPAVPALIAASVWSMSGAALFSENATGPWPLILIALISAALVLRSKINPAWIIVAGGVVGAIFLR